MNKYKGNIPQSNIDTIDGLIKDGIFKVLSEPVRLNIIKFLVINGESDISTIAKSFTQDRSVISRHLMVMEQAGILEKSKESRYVVYSFNGREFLSKLESVVETIRTLVDSCDECED
ncbi:MAG: metalloregulator ArsR/SmtB family transcription factor [Eubacteriales bacterium]